MPSMPKKEVNRKENAVEKIAMVTDSKGCYLKRCFLETVLYSIVFM